MDQFTCSDLFIGTESLMTETVPNVIDTFDKNVQDYSNIKNLSSNIKELTLSDVSSDFNGDELNEAINTINKMDPLKIEKHYSTKIHDNMKEFTLLDVDSDINGDPLNEVINTINEINELKKETNLSKVCEVKPLKYECDICKKSFSDYGVHMCMVHKMLKCSFTDHKDMFFSCLYELRNHQNEFHMDDIINCFKCDEIFSNNYTFVKHCKTIHEVDFCILCLSFIGNKSEFDDHMKSHSIANIEKLKIKSNIPLLLSWSFATVQKVQSISVVICYLCSMKFGVRMFMQHFQNIHRVKNPSLTLFPLFDGVSFSFKTLDFDTMDDCNTKETGSPNNPSIVYAEAFEVLDKLEEINITCSQCEKQFKSNKCLTAHVKRVHDQSDQLYPCNICGKQFRQKKDRNEHQAQRHLEKSVPCLTCGKLFKHKHDVKGHARRVHIQPDLVYPCNICGKKFRYEKERNEHQAQKRHTERNLPCLTCGKLFKNKNEVNIHGRIHWPTKAFSCKFCTKAFNQSSNMMSHIRKYHSRELEKYSPQEMYSRNEMVSDIKIYKKIPQKRKESKSKKPCPCKLCGKLYRSKSELRSHIEYVHYQEKNVPCMECEKIFASVSGRQAHIRRVHKRETFSCKICNKEFSSNGDVKKHVDGVHAEIKSVACPIPTCFKFFKLKVDIRRHLISHTSIQAFTCQYCNKSFNQNSNMWTHIKKKHSSEPLVQQKYSLII